MPRKKTSLKQGYYREMWHEYACPHCSHKTMISDPVWQESYKRKCAKCRRLYGIDPDHGEE